MILHQCVVIIALCVMHTCNIVVGCRSIGMLRAEDFFTDCKSFLILHQCIVRIALCLVHRTDIVVGCRSRGMLRVKDFFFNLQGFLILHQCIVRIAPIVIHIANIVIDRRSILSLPPLQRFRQCKPLFQQCRSVRDAMQMIYTTGIGCCGFRRGLCFIHSFHVGKESAARFSVVLLHKCVTNDSLYFHSVRFCQCKQGGTHQFFARPVMQTAVQAGFGVVAFEDEGVPFVSQGSMPPAI